MANKPFELYQILPGGTERHITCVYSKTEARHLADTKLPKGDYHLKLRGRVVEIFKGEGSELL